MEAKGMFKSEFGALFWKLWEFKLADKICAELSASFVMIVSVPRGH